MKTLVFFGSARKQGNTKKLLNKFLKQLNGEIKVINAYKLKVEPCIDCRYCWENQGCSIKDNMQSIYPLIDGADNIIFASPIYFNGIPAPLKAIIDRCQTYWSSRVRPGEEKLKKKRAVLLLCGGAPSFNKQFVAADIILKGLLKELNAELAGHIYVPNTDQVSVSKNKKVVEKAKELSSKINKCFAKD